MQSDPAWAAGSAVKSLPTSAVSCLSQSLHYNFKGAHLVNRNDKYCFLLLCADHFPNTSPCECVHTCMLLHTNTGTDGLCSYLVYANNDLGILKRIIRIMFKYLCQKDNVSQYENDISLIVLSQRQTWKKWMCRSHNSLQSNLLHTSGLSHISSKKVVKSVKQAFTCKPSTSCFYCDHASVGLRGTAFQKTPKTWTSSLIHHSPAALCQHVLSRAPVVPDHYESETQYEISWLDCTMHCIEIINYKLCLK